MCGKSYALTQKLRTDLHLIVSSSEHLYEYQLQQNRKLNIFLEQKTHEKFCILLTLLY